MVSQERASANNTHWVGSNRLPYHVVFSPIWEGNDVAYQPVRRSGACKDAVQPGQGTPENRETAYELLVRIPVYNTAYIFFSGSATTVKIQTANWPKYSVSPISNREF